jgi:hypothetical protein
MAGRFVKCDLEMMINEVVVLYPLRVYMDLAGENEKNKSLGQYRCF